MKILNMKKIALCLGTTCLFCMPNLLVVSCSKSEEQIKDPSNNEDIKDPSNHEDTKIISVVNSENLSYNSEKVNFWPKFKIT